MDSPRSDRGFTLPEILVTVVVIGILIGVVAAVFSVITRTAPATQERADDARTLSNLTKWVPADVQSTEPGGIVDPTSPQCSGVPTSDGLLSLRWTEGRQYNVDYRWVPESADADAPGQIKRYSCLELGAAVEQKMSPILERLPDGSGTRVPVTVTPIGSTGVTFEVEVFDETVNRVRDILNIDARSLNIPDPPLELPSSGGGSAPTNAAPIASDLLVGVHPGGTYTYNVPVIDVDGTLDKLAFATLVPPAGWTAAITRGSVPTIGLTVSATAVVDSVERITYVATDKDGAGLASNTGTIEITVLDPTATLPDPVVRFPPPPPLPCTGTIDTPVADAVVRLNGGRGADPFLDTLKDNLDVFITRSDTCGALVLLFTPDPLNPVVISEPFRGATDLRIRKNAEDWRVGPVVLTLQDSESEAVLDTVTIQIGAAL
jgi:prepilin-type N-terminal cleavage/methylation domain-containing protein